MKIILNSDVIFSKDLRRTDLPSHVLEFAQRLVGTEHIIILPQTTVLEFESKQTIARNALRTKITDAHELLTSLGVDVPGIEVDALLPHVGLVPLLEKLEGLQFQIAMPTIEDYSVAMRKACAREAPHPPESKSDEMRDLVIWQMALRLSSDEDGAILLSRDEVHCHFRGDAEAQIHGLLRVKDFEPALEILNLETISGNLIKNLLAQNWAKVIEIGLPLVHGAHVVYVKDPLFELQANGMTHCTCELKIATGAGGELICKTEIRFVENSISRIKTSGVGQDYEMEFESPPVVETFADKLDALRKNIGTDN